MVENSSLQPDWAEVVGNLLFPIGILWEQSCGTEPFTCGIGHHVHIDSVQNQLNFTSPSWCHRELLDVEKNLRIW